ncbi:MAG TPA: hypothetical protein VNX68_00235 [Nitrosopumilaceae archaeon]|jgi:hypothetical protein|nr:hypothetical protein [Nitrosopumilaceae archaeon]
MNKRLVGCLIMMFTVVMGFNAVGIDQNEIHKDTLVPAKGHQQSDKASLLTYMRVISNSNGSFRTDQNIVPKFILSSWLRLEVGFRCGERPQHLNSYYHYKAELQTRYFWRTARIIARISDNVIQFPNPIYRKTNELFAVETKFPLYHSFQGIVSGGYVFSAQQNNDISALPTSQGTQANYPIFKLALRYLIKDKGFVEMVYGSYDVFNPYEINRPFTQFSSEYELSHSATLYSYLRYQYDYNAFKPYNYFLGLGVIFHLVKG